ncbi:uncharacterized protein DUF4383 [Stackebrandtia endophytica]|uniref:Uncharacterized protein DUF4383 n=1 Tax=Stackebrandtia endophytica TaxID=1496996 RepID=A0A543B067_9ACTN|nr:DUF4383 domain-containing protein [Stackebrandtia endophytica]TQL78235.1 uncharacterized protein DUF4383 [Stackebrandtia endophytica]
MDHLPINHPLRPLWRGLAFLAGVYIVVFGVIGFIEAQSAGLDWFAQTGLPSVMFLKANPAFSLMSIVVGAIVVIGALVGRNVDRWINLLAGTVFLLAGMGMMLVLRTDVNFFGFTMSACIASFILGLVMLTAGLYGRVGTVTEAEREEGRRHRHVGDNSGLVGDA